MEKIITTTIIHTRLVKIFYISYNLITFWYVVISAFLKFINL